MWLKFSPQADVKFFSIALGVINLLHPSIMGKLKGIYKVCYSKVIENIVFTYRIVTIIFHGIVM